MTEMIAAEPAVAERVLSRLADPAGAAARVAAAVRTAAEAGRPVIVVGCGTSEHGALGVAGILRDAAAAAGLPSQPGEAGAAIPIQAFEASLAPVKSGLVIGVSHEGGTWATMQALEAARGAGSKTALITASDRSPAAALADEGLVIATGELDQSWCHTIGYLSPLLAGASIGAHLSRRSVDIPAASGVLRTTTAMTTAAEGIAGALAGVRQLLVIGSGADRTAARELTLKVEEASWLPTAMRDLETFLHGHLPATDEFTGLVLVLAERRGRPARVKRAREALAAARELGHRTAAILSEEASAQINDDLTPAGRIVVADATSLPPTVAALLGTLVPLQLVTERIARVRGTNPDPIRRDDPRYLAAAEASHPG
jgi:glutamine---fructose-6-phosphate transaminase (isomerizing)